MTKMPTKVLVYEYISGGGCADADVMRELLPAGRAMRNAIAGDLARVAGVSVTCAMTASEAGDAARRAPDTRQLAYCQPPAGSDPCHFVGKEALHHDAVWVIAPETDGVLARFCDAVETSRWIGCDAESIRIASSKRRTARRLAQAGIATTRAWSVDAPLQPGPGAWVVKPDDGAGAVDTLFYHDFRTAEYAFLHRAAAHERVTFEEWVEGDAMSLSLLCNHGSAELLSINWQHVSVVGGRVRYDGVTVGSIALNSLVGYSCRELARRIAAALPGLAGFVGIDVVWHRERGPVVIEINPRATCAYADLAKRGELDLAARILANHRAEQADDERTRHAA
ncbi:ATP-grasp domain-containing protein [Paraburkholderia sp. 1N]|uniref:ATP-grasp domain-containing protein n=1 Tax=Paraburkholderia solitsugae TaxID=2675748 RepID=A0ABX2BHJ9_9BURK|nr:ATP-grasp domain-containing protein [Paraburkholderia solitsugae]NPT40400.1 ATP-grasp domain-containing protein [Paraburkholderia solitsugae]